MVTTLSQLLVFVLLVCHCQCYYQQGVRRDYFISVEDHWWDYAPSKENFITNDTSFSDPLMNPQPNRIGSMFRKAIMKQWTDRTFSTEIPPEPWMGFVGPLLKGETGDVLYVHFKNSASRAYGLHPHGVQYFKDSEGALYADGTKGDDKLDDQVPPGKIYTYRWSMLKGFAPTDDDDNCVPQGYHPHIRYQKDVDTGLIGMLIVCKRGILRKDLSRKDVDREFVLYADILNETNSWLIEESLEKCGNPAVCKQLFQDKNPAFVGSTFIFQVNGFVYGNLPDFPMYKGEKVVFYSMGLILGVHIFGAQGHTWEVKKKRANAYQIGNGVFEALNMVAQNPGRWLLFCRAAFHFRLGMAAFINVKPSPYKEYYRHKYRYSHKRRYYIAAEEIKWNYIPTGKVWARVGVPSAERISREQRFLTHSAATGGRYKKAVFREYTDGTFTKLKKQTYRDKHRGFIGPVIRVEVGERLEVVFKNKASRQYSFHPFGLPVKKKYEGALYKNDRSSNEMSGAMAMPGEVRVYKYDVAEGFGPTESDPQCITSTYQSFADYLRDVYSGLVGPLLICRPKTLDYKGRQRGIDREFILMSMFWIERYGWYMDESIALASGYGKTVDTTSPSFGEVNSMRAINGRIFGNTRGFAMCIGDRVSWHVLGFGDRLDHHSYMFEGNNLKYDGRQVEYVTVFPGRAETVYMEPDNPGIWLLYDGQLGFQTDGMVTNYVVYSCKKKKYPKYSYKKKNRRVVKLYIAAVEINWDYIPRKLNTVTMTSLNDPSTPGHIYVKDDDEFIGSTYKKAVYRQFTDDTFTKEVPRCPHDTHLGLLGPFIRAEVGDLIQIVYKNMASFKNSIKLHNLPVDNKVAFRQRFFGVKPGKKAVYRWYVPERSGPGPAEPNCVGYSYESSVYPKRDLASGLIGPLILCRKGVLDKYRNRLDEIDKEFATAFVIFQEADSHYFTENVAARAPNRTNLQDFFFRTANTRFTMNGYSFQNIPHLFMKFNDKVAWHSYSFGSLGGEHTNHIHGLTFITKTYKSFRNDVLTITPGSHETFEMLADNPGTWMVHCHVGLHLSGGMFGVYTVAPKYTRPKGYGDSKSESESKGKEESESKMYNNRPQNPHSKRPRYPHNNRPQNPHSKKPRYPHNNRPQNPHSKKPRYPHNNRPQNPHSKKPRYPHNNRPQNPHSKKPRYPHNNRPQNSHSKKPRYPHNDRPRTPHVIYI